MVYIEFKYVYVHIWVRQQLEYTLKSKKKEKRDPLASGVGASAGVPPLVSVRNTTRD
jgi:hypothetical protein